MKAIYKCGSVKPINESSAEVQLNLLNFDLSDLQKSKILERAKAGIFPDQIAKDYHSVSTITKGKFTGNEFTSTHAEFKVIGSPDFKEGDLVEVSLKKLS